MTAKLTALQIDEKTEAFLKRVMTESRSGDDLIAKAYKNGDLTDNPILLNKLPSGDYFMRISAELDRNTKGQFDIIRADNFKKVHSVSIDLRPIVQSILDDPDDDNEAFYEEYRKAEESGNKKRLAELNNFSEITRGKKLEGKFRPHISNDNDFNIKLMGMIDFLGYPIIEKDVLYGINTDIDPKALETKHKGPKPH